MDLNAENTTPKPSSDQQKITYASVVSKAKEPSDDMSNNNPPPHPSVDKDNLNKQLQDLMTKVGNENGALVEENKNSSLTNTSSSLNDSFEDAEDTQSNFTSFSSKDFVSDSKGNDGAADVSSIVSVETLSSEERNSSNLEMNESNSGNSPIPSESEEERSDTLYPSALKWRFRSPSASLKLPDTVTVLETEFGSKVYLVGTAHFSMESQEDVAKTIRAVQPDCVLLELCKSRINMLSLDEATILEEAEGLTFQKIATTIEQNGMLQAILYFLLLSMSAHLTKQLGMAPGGEFRRAYNEALQIPGCHVQLGDRPIHITLQRALAKLSMWQKVRIAWHMLRSKGPVTKEEVERCKNKDLLEEMLAEMTGEFPELSQVFVSERDIFLTYSLQIASLPMGSPRSDLPVPSTVVGVVGIGHVAGIKEHWGKVKDEDIGPILYVPETSLGSKVLRQTIRISLIGLGVYSVYKVFPRSLIPSRPRINSFFNSIF